LTGNKKGKAGHQEASFLNINHEFCLKKQPLSKPDKSENGLISTAVCNQRKESFRFCCKKNTCEEKENQKAFTLFNHFYYLSKKALTVKIKLMIKKIILNSGVQIIGKAASIVISLLITGLLTRRLGTNQYGQYIFIFSLVNLVVAVANWGTQIIGVRELAKAKNQAKTFGSILGLRTFLALIAGAVSGVLIILLPTFEGIRLLAFLGLFLVILTSLESSFEIIFQSQIKMGLKTKINLVYSLSFFAVTYILITKNFGIISPFVGAIVAKGISNIASLIYSKKLITKPFALDITIIKKILKESLPMGLLLVLFSTYDQAIDSLIIKKFLGLSQVGFYGLAYKIYANLVLPAYFLSNTIFPIISKNPKKNLNKLNKAAFKLMALLIIAIVPTTIILSPIIIRIIAGAEFNASIIPLKILALALIFAYINHINGFSLIAIGHQQDSLKIGLIALLWNLILNLIFIPQYGINAAAIITVLTEALTTVIGSIMLVARKRSYLKLEKQQN